MSNWSLVPEFMALLLLGVIMLFFYDKQRVRTFRRSLYWACLWLSAASIVLNVICVYTIEYAERVPIWCNICLNNLYFWLSMLMCSTVAFYLFQRMLEYVYDKHCLKKAFTGLAMVMIAYTILALWNLKSGIFFYFDEMGNYQRGIFNRIGYLGLLIELIMLCICYIRNRKSISKDMERVLHVILPVVIGIALLQVSVLRSLYLNGTIIAIVDLIIFISFQSRPIETDSLTGLGNRKSFFDEISLRTVSRQQYQIISVSLHNFGSVTRKLGYKTGDAVLHEISQFFAGLHREARAYRVSNVSFAVLLPWCEPWEQEYSIDTILRRFEEEWIIGEDSCRISLHGASLSYQNQAWTPEQVLTYLEYALSLAKAEDVTMVRFDQEIEKRYQRKEYLIETMQRAIEDKRFQVYYQPVYHCKEGRFASAEALLRLKDYQDEDVSPVEFIPLAEETGMIDDISWIVIEKVCALMGGQGVPGLNQVSINLSMQQFLQKDLLERVEALFEKYGTPPDRLRFEITERVLLDDEEYIKDTMKRMKEHGLQFYLDDFGTGYANFSSVLDLPFEVVKLDRSLLAEHPDNPKAKMLPDILISFFHSLGQTIVVEGVETEEQKEWMMRCGVDRIQGFYYARPMPQEELLALFKQ